MKKLFLTTIATLLFSTSIQAEESELLTGDTRYACEAILCLSSSVRPSECSPSLNKYFSIKVFRKGVLHWGRTVDARKAFLNLCPAASTDVNMVNLIDSLSKGAERCDAEYLNRTLKTIKTKLVCTGSGDSDTCETINYTEIRNTKPSYCSAYENHEYTRDVTAQYIGTPDKSGFWANHNEYEEKLQKYNELMERLKEEESKKNNFWGRR